MALSRVVSEIFNVEKCRDLEIGVRGHSRSSKVLSFDRSCMKSGSEVTQGHRKCNHSIDRVWFPISVLQ